MKRYRYQSIIYYSDARWYFYDANLRCTTRCCNLFSTQMTCTCGIHTVNRHIRFDCIEDIIGSMYGNLRDFRRWVISRSVRTILNGRLKINVLIMPLVFGNLVFVKLNELARKISHFRYYLRRKFYTWANVKPHKFPRSNSLIKDIRFYVLKPAFDIIWNNHRSRKGNGYLFYFK